jgi:3-hydroxyisobutyrate dehydrogenase-like beta-hydroxyacid dehydrogenase
LDQQPPSSAAARSRGESRPVGIAGLGLIGTSLARRLLAAGFTVCGYDIQAERRALLAELGGQPVDAAAALGERCGTLVIAVLSTDQVEAVIDTVHLRPGSLVICTSTCDPDRIEALASRLAPDGIRFVEMPLSGNSDQIALGNGVGLIGGAAADVAAASDVIAALCARCFHLGAVGAGGRAKLAVNLIGGLNRAVLAEGLAFAESMGLELVPLLEVLKASAAYSRTMDNRGIKMANSDFTPHAKVAQSRKDFALMHEAARRCGQELPLASVYLELIENCLAQGEGDLDNSAIISELRRRRRRD